MVTGEPASKPISPLRKLFRKTYTAAHRGKAFWRERLERWFPDSKVRAAKDHWRGKRNECQTGPTMFEAIPVEAQSGIKRVLEFGCNWGGNLAYFLDRLPGAEAVGIDINPVVRSLEERYPGAYLGIVGDESTLARFSNNEFDLAMTSSVLDHIPSPAIVRNVIRELVRTSRQVMLLEPWIEGVEGDVSGKVRGQVRKDLPAPHKPFAPHSYLWNYDAILTQLGVRWSKRPQPLHAASLGPFYFLYAISKSTDPYNQ